MQNYRGPEKFKAVSFLEYSKDPYNRKKKIDPKEAELKRWEKFEKSLIYEKVKKRGQESGMDT